MVNVKLDIAKPSNIAGRMNLVYGLVRHQSLVAQWLKHPTDVRKMIGSISVGTFSLSQCEYQLSYEGSFI